ncbi:MAG: hypothetical protein R3E54_14250 [Halioglobus sp.]
MLSLNKLEKVIELEEQLRAQYQSQLDEQAAEIEKHRAANAELQARIDAQQTTIEQQLATITDLSSKVTDTLRVEQLNRELNNRADKLQDELTETKKRLKTAQKDLAAERIELKELKQFDPARMKKNLDANKKKLAEKTRASDLLQKSLNASKNENSELKRELQELKAKLEALEPAAEESTDEENVAA